MAEWDGHKIEEERMHRDKLAKNNATVINHATGICTRFGCKNRDRKCDGCIRFSEYMA